VFDIDIIDGNIVLKPQDVVSKQAIKRPIKSKSVDISKWVGSGKGLFKSVDEIDEFIRFERSQWE
jgi:hypothetical protein